MSNHSNSSNPSNHILHFVSANVRGLKNDSKLEEICVSMQKHSTFAALIQETWKMDVEELTLRDFTFLLNGPSSQAGRGSKGVGIVLSKDAESAWRLASNEIHTDHGPRVIAIRVVFPMRGTGKQGLFLISAYAPMSTAPQAEWDTFLNNLRACIDRQKIDDILIIGMDCNASMGTRSSSNHQNNSGTLGPFGNPRVNPSGIRLLTFLQQLNLIVVTTYFQKPPHKFITWKSPARRSTTRTNSNLNFQLDHFISNKHNLKHFTDAAVGQQITNSDHSTIYCIVNLKNITNSHQQRTQSNQQTTLRNIDFSLLQQPQQVINFCEKVRSLYQSSPLSTRYKRLMQAATKATEVMFPKKRKSTKDWFTEAKDTLIPLIHQRNLLFKRYTANSSQQNTSLLRTARKTVRTATRRAQNKWILDLSRTVNTSCTYRSASQQCWKAIKTLKKGLNNASKRKSVNLKKPDGSTCTSPAENADTFHEHFQQLFQRQPVFDRSVLDTLPQHNCIITADREPDDDEIRTAIRGLNHTAPGISGIPSAVWKALATEESSFALIRELIF